MNSVSTTPVSVVVPLFNKGAFIARALDSIFRQTFQDFEVIVVDDGSTDDGPATVRRYADQRLRLIVQPNAGPGAARNQGLRESRYPLVAFLDADDEWAPEFLARCVTGLTTYPDCALAITGYREGPRQIDQQARLHALGVTEGPWVIRPDIHPRRLKQLIDSFNPSMVVGRRDIMQGYGGFYAANRCTFGEDTYLWVKVLFAHAVYRTTAPLVWFHTEASTLDHNRTTAFPLKPVLTDPVPLYNACPPTGRDLLVRCLAAYALSAMKLRFRAGNTAGAVRLRSDFPQMKGLGWSYHRLRMEMALDPLLRRIRANSILHSWARRCKSLLLPAHD